MRQQNEEEEEGETDMPGLDVNRSVSLPLLPSGLGLYRATTIDNQEILYEVGDTENGPLHVISFGDGIADPSVGDVTMVQVIDRNQDNIIVLEEVTGMVRNGYTYSFQSEDDCDANRRLEAFNLFETEIQNIDTNSFAEVTD
ncbi:MAG: hypothetical protein SFZ03_00980 [Candidatus Melainabacteria bacterium]|nr:hypothetical protein [Candidatus Melainabacteria bacterium]